MTTIDYCGICKAKIVLPGPGVREGRCAQHSTPCPDEPLFGIPKDIWMTLSIEHRAEGHLLSEELERSYKKLTQSNVGRLRDLVRRTL